MLRLVAPAHVRVWPDTHMDFVDRNVFGRRFGRSAPWGVGTSSLRRASLQPVWRYRFVSWSVPLTAQAEATRLTYAVGHYFDRVEEQDAMLAILEQTQKDYARPTGSVRREMLQVWGRHTGMSKSLAMMHMNSDSVMNGH